MLVNDIQVKLSFLVDSSKNNDNTRVLVHFFLEVAAWGSIGGCNDRGDCKAPYHYGGSGYMISWIILNLETQKYNSQHSVHQKESCLQYLLLTDEHS